MNEQELYDLVFLREHENALQAINEITSNECLRLSLTAIILCRSGKFDESEKLLSEINDNECDSFSKSVLLEAKIFHLPFKKKEFNKIEELADLAFSINPKAVYARITKGLIEINHGRTQSGKTQSGVDFILSVAEEYPNVNWIYIILVQNLALANEHKYAQKFVEKIEPKIRRNLYYLLLKYVSPLPNKFLWGSILLILFLIRLFPIPNLILSIMVPSVIMAIYGKIKEDRFLFKESLFFPFVILYYYLLIYLCTAIFP
jgi:hypothetical protein